MLGDSIHRLYPRPFSYPFFTLFLYYSIWSIIRECIMTSQCLLQFLPAQGTFGFFQRFLLVWFDWLETLHRNVNIDTDIGSGNISTKDSDRSGGVMSCVCVYAAVRVYFYDCVHTCTGLCVCVCVCVSMNVYGIGGRQSGRSHEPWRARNESGNGDDPRGLWKKDLQE